MIKNLNEPNVRQWFSQIIVELQNGRVIISRILDVYNSYHQTTYIRLTLVGNKIVNHSDVVEAAPIFST